MKQTQRDSNKPPYLVPSIKKVGAMPWNGFTVASTFSGCGGSCLGYRMAGFKVAWANEFVPAAQASYRANAPDCYLDPRDIKLVQPGEVLAVLKLKKGQLDIFDGSPPCQAFSTAGKREKGWGKDKSYEHGAKQKNETLFDQYIRLLRGLMPKVFIAENVSGLIKGAAKGYFLEILAALKASGYKVECRLLDAQWLGVPQQRQRVIFMGVRNDLGLAPAYPSPLPYRYSVRDALPWITGLVEGAGNLAPNKPGNSFPRNKKRDIEKPCGTVTCGLAGINSAPSECETKEGKRKFTIKEIKSLCSFPADFELKGSYAQQWERLGNAVPPVMMAAIATVVRDQILRKIKKK